MKIKILLNNIKLNLKRNKLKRIIKKAIKNKKSIIINTNESHRYIGKTTILENFVKEMGLCNSIVLVKYLEQQNKNTVFWKNIFDRSFLRGTRFNCVFLDEGFTNEEIMEIKKEIEMYYTCDKCPIIVLNYTSLDVVNL